MKKDSEEKLAKQLDRIFKRKKSENSALEKIVKSLKKRDNKA